MNKIQILRLIAASSWAMVQAACGASDCQESHLRIHADFPLDCVALAANVTTARQMLDSTGVVAASDFTRHFKETPVTLVSYEPGKPGIIAGRYDPVRGVVMSEDGVLLLHLLLHQVELSRGTLELVVSESHPAWPDRGWTKLDFDFQSAARRVRLSP